MPDHAYGSTNQIDWQIESYLKGKNIDDMKLSLPQVDCLKYTEHKKRTL